MALYADFICSPKKKKKNTVYLTHRWHTLPHTGRAITVKTAPVIRMFFLTAPCGNYQLPNWQEDLFYTHVHEADMTHDRIYCLITLKLRDKTHSELSSLSWMESLFIMVLLTVPDTAPFSVGADTAYPPHICTPWLPRPHLPVCSRGHWRDGSLLAWDQSPGGKRTEGKGLKISVAYFKTWQVRLLQTFFVLAEHDEDRRAAVCCWAVFAGCHVVP